MFILKENLLSVLNRLIYEIYSIDDIDEMRMKVLGLLQYLIPHNVSAFYLSSREAGSSHLLTRPVGIGVTSEELETYIENYEKENYTSWVSINPKNMAYRESDLFPDGGRNELMKSPYYIYKAHGIKYSALLSLAYEKQFMGVISLYRTGEPDFSNREIFILDLLKDHLSLRIYRDYPYNARKDPVETEESKDLKEFDAYGLTPRETEILRLLLKATPNDDICKKFSISPNTLKKHLSNIYKKAGVGSRWELLKQK